MNRLRTTSALLCLMLFGLTAREAWGQAFEVVPLRLGSRDAGATALDPRGLNAFGQVVGSGGGRGDAGINALWVIEPDGTYYKDEDGDGWNDLARQVTTLEELRTRPIGEPILQRTVPVSLSNQGHVTATIQEGSYVGHLFKRVGRTVLQSGQSTGAVPRGVNARGEAVGAETLKCDAVNYNTNAVVWALGKPIPLGVSCAGAASCQCRSYAFGINDRGVVVGYSYITNPDSRSAFRWDGTTLDLGKLGGPTSQAMAINNAGRIAGRVDVVVDGGTLVHAAVWEPGSGWKVLGTPDGGVQSWAAAINAHDEVVGTYSWPAFAQNWRAFLYLPKPNYGLPAGMHDLSSVAGVTLYNAEFISDQGQILAGYETANYSFSWHLITPKGAFPSKAPPGGTHGDSPEAGDDAEPVSTLTGEFFTPPVVDLRLGGPLPLTFERSYASGLDRTDVPRSLGGNWRHGFEWQLEREAPERVAVRSPLGGLVRFELSGAAWVARGSPAQLVETSGAFTFLDPREGLVRSFDAEGRLTGVASRAGHALTLSHDAEGRLSTVSDGLGRTLTLTYRNDGLLASVSDGQRTVRYGYLDRMLVSVTDALGNVTRYDYDDPADARLVSFRLPAGNVPLRNVYDSAGRVVRQHDAADAGTVFEWLPDDVTKVTDPLGAASLFAHAAGRLESFTDPAGGKVSIAYGSGGERATVTGKDDAVTRYAWHAPSGLLERKTLPDDAQLQCSYQPLTQGGLTQYLRTRVEWPDGSAETFEYDTSGRLTRATGPGGEIGQTWTTEGLLATRTGPHGDTATFTWNADGTVSKVESAAGGAISLGYDALGRHTKTTWPDGHGREWTFDALDRLTSFTDELGATRRYEWNDNGDLVAVQSPTGGAIRFVHDANDRVVAVERPGGGRTELRYDLAGRLAELLGPGQRTRFGRDGRGLVTSVTDGAGHAWSFQHDAAGRPVSAADPLGNRWELGWDARGRLTSVTDGSGQKTTMSWDARSRLTSIAHGDLRESLEYGPAGLTRVVGADGAVTALERDGAGLLKSATDPLGGKWSFERDTLGRLIARVDPLGNRWEATLDARGRSSRVTLPGGGTVELTYDAAGRTLRRSYSDGLIQSFSYDEAGRRTAANEVVLRYDAAGQLVAHNGLSATRDEAGRLVSSEVAPGRAVSYGYDARGLLVSVRDWLGGETRLVRDAAGNVTRVERPNGVATEQDYDGTGRLTGIRESGAFGSSSIALVRDSLGNVTSATRELPLAAGVGLARAAELEASWTVDAAHQRSGAEHDPMGRLRSSGERRFEWNLATQLVSMTLGADPVALGYDGLGDLVSRREGERVRRYVWSHAHALPAMVAEYEGGAPATFYVYTPGGELLYALDAATSARRHYHYDERGSTLFRTGEDGMVIDAWAYDPYGNVLRSRGGADNPFTFAGRYGALRLADGLYGMRRRVYDARAGRFLSREPVADRLHPARMSPYAYALGNPLRYVDPWGEDPKEAKPKEEKGFTGSAADEALDKLTNLAGKTSEVAGVVSERIKGNTDELIRRQVQAALQNAPTREWGPGMEALEKLGGKADKLNDIGEKIGVAGNVVEGATELVKYYEKSEELLGDIRTSSRSNGDLLALLGAEIERLRQEEKISYTTAVAWSRQLQQDFESSQEGAWAAYVNGMSEATLRTGTKAASQLLSEPGSMAVDAFMPE